MMEEFRRRRNLKKYYEMMKERIDKSRKGGGKRTAFYDMDETTLEMNSQYPQAGPERFFTPSKEEIFNPSEFTLMFMDSDSVTNVTALNRTNHRRVLLFIGNGNGLISYGMGKGVDYEQAFEAAYKTLRRNLIILDMS